MWGVLFAACTAVALQQGGRHARIPVRCSATEGSPKKRVVVIGNGMVGQRFVELCAEKAAAKEADVEIVSFCEERLAAYNRVRLTSWFETRDANALSLVGEYAEDGQGEWYREREDSVTVRVGEKAEKLDLEKKTAVSTSGDVMPYDVAVLATGSYPFVPPIEGKDLKGVFVYRTIDDLEALVAYQKAHGIERAAVIGGGLLGLEAAKALHDLGLATSILEYAPILMCRQIDQGGHDALLSKVEALGLEVKCNARVAEFLGDDQGVVAGVRYSNDGWDDDRVGIVVISAGIRPRDEVAKQSGIETHERGGVIVDDALRTSDPSVYAIGEVALHAGKIYGLVAPGYSMAEIAAENIINQLAGVDDSAPRFEGADMSTKLKLLGCDVASFGNIKESDDTTALVWNDPVADIYRKLLFNKADNRLEGGILVGDASDYSELHALQKSGDSVSQPATLLAPRSALASSSSSSSQSGADEAPTKQICSCNDVSRGALVAACSELGPSATYAELKAMTRAGSGCGGCEPDVKKILSAELEKMGAAVKNHICEHFEYSRPELMALVNSGNLQSFEEALAAHGKGTDGCEICKPAVASMLASLHNEVILTDGRMALQDTNDRSLANMQRGGSYSVVPRVPGGEITPEGLVAMGEVAAKYGLYSKITGAQRIDLFGAAKHQLPDIWEDLGKAGFESGHAYGKALRTVKSCVGSSWCRYGVQNSVDFAIVVENRYKGLRAPHKLKSAVSGCIRECAEASSKDFAMIATDAGYDLYLCGNGGANPRHGVLFASGIDEETVLKYLDRFLMYYCLTGERLERTARWFERLGPNDEVRLQALQDVIIHDKLGLNAEFEARMQHIVDTYHDEWAVVVADPDLRAKFKQFANTDDVQPADEMIEFMDVRGQRRPVDWPADGAPQTMWRPPSDDPFARSEKSWVGFGPSADFPPNLGTPVLYGSTQLAIFNTGKEGKWYATQNLCPHKQAFVLAQGIVGLAGDTPKVACPLHKKQFGLEDGKQIDGDLNIITFPIRLNQETGEVEVELPARDEIDAVLGTSLLKVTCPTEVHVDYNAMPNTTFAAEVVKAR
ncbi:hypothetical protein CTAYLR_008381 [Chrysophaeum taylorii]|uniref:Rieske domain-containing protein n=1 Tax=Chrysophaeum taylorii TaxID=2483200 RepID=A0AAD7UHE9_9STRA|nr:hypothetical protein CTAYLR_008381 [Chrysophaeum taylorii]